MEDNGMEELRLVVTRLARLVETIGQQQQQSNTRWDEMAARWDGYIVEQRQFNREQRQMNARLQAILERLLPGSNGR
jgi:hypothetical protein